MCRHLTTVVFYIFFQTTCVLIFIVWTQKSALSQCFFVYLKHNKFQICITKRGICRSVLSRVSTMYTAYNEF
jgi:hypothetical protein